jgi:hypothetical protein
MGLSCFSWAMGASPYRARMAGSTSRRCCLKSNVPATIAGRWRKTGNFDCENGSKAAAVRNPASLAHAAVSGAGYAVGGTEIFTDGRSSIF